MRATLTVVLLVLGLGVVMASCVGMAVLSDPLDRLHLVTPASTIGVGAVAAAVVAHAGLDASGVSAILLAAAVATANPLVSHATARSIAVRRRAEQDDTVAEDPT